MKETSSPLLEMHNVLVKRGKKPVLFVNELALYAGEVLAVVGPNGAGKSTLLLTLARLIQPSQGKILYKNVPMDEWDDLSYRRQMSIVFQEPLLVDGTVMDNIILGLRLRGISKKEAVKAMQPWLEKLNLSEIAKRKVSQLSGGEAHRVSLARALVLEPQLLLLDEPFSALDPPSRLRLLDDLAGLLNHNHRTTLFVTHHLKEAARLGDRVAVLLDGVVRQVGTMDEIERHPLDNAVTNFVASEI